MLKAVLERKDTAQWYHTNVFFIFHYFSNCVIVCNALKATENGHFDSVKRNRASFAMRFPLAYIGNKQIYVQPLLRAIIFTFD